MIMAISALQLEYEKRAFFINCHYINWSNGCRILNTFTTSQIDVKSQVHPVNCDLCKICC